MNVNTDRAARWTPLWLLIAMAATVLYATVLFGIGVPAGSVTATPMDWVQPLLVPSLGLVAAGLVTATVSCGASATWSGVRYLAGRARESEYPRAARALGVAGAFVLHAGVALGFVGLLLILSQLLGSVESSRSGEPAHSTEEWRALVSLIARARLAIFFAAPLGIVLGRILLGVPAESAALKAGVERPRFSIGTQVLALVIVPTFVVLSFLKYPTLPGQ